MISQKAFKHAEKCKFCWMCRHLCPIQLKTGKEINTPRAKGLLLSMNARGVQPFDQDLAKAMYECLLCDACVNDCATGYQPPLYIREARTEAVLQELAPAEVMDLIENAEKSGNIYGEKKEIFAGDGEDVLVYVGDVAAVKAPEFAKAFLALLKKAGVKARVLENEPSSGQLLSDLIGYVDEVVEVAKACKAAIENTGIKKVVVLDSYDAQIMIQQYPEWGCEISAEIVTATSFVAELIVEGKLSAAPAAGLGSCHDDDRLARTFHEFEPIRTIAKAAGFELTEMFNTQLLAKSCGSASSLAYMPEIVKLVAQGRWEDLQRTDAKAMLVVNPQSYLCLREAIPEGYLLVNLYEALA